jgi:hypothetical protein
MDDKELRLAAMLPAIASSYKPPAADPMLCTEQRIHSEEDPSSETIVVFDCRHPGCGKTFHSSDAVRKHARKQHPFWLCRIDEEASLTRLTHRTEQYSAKRIVSRSEHEAAVAAQRAAESDGSDDELQDSEAAFAAPDPKRTFHATSMSRPRLAPASREWPWAGGARLPQQASSRPGTDSPRDHYKRLSLSAGRPAPSPKGEVARSHKKQQPPAAAHYDDYDAPKVVQPAEDLSGYTQPSCLWNRRRAAYDAILPHGESWSTQQVEWFVGLWWKHLANASVATFRGSLEQFSAWAAANEGLECLVAWLKRMPELGEDLLLLQLLELLEYADLPPSTLLPELTEAVRALITYSDRDVAETAERVMLLLEEQSAERRRKGERRAAAAAASAKAPADFKRPLQTSEAARLQRLQAAEARECYEASHRAFERERGGSFCFEPPDAPGASSSRKFAPPRDVGAPPDGAPGGGQATKRRGHPGDGPPKKKPLLPNDVKEYLTKWCLDNIDSPYPNEREKHDLCASTHLTLTQVNNWCVACDAPTKSPRAT